MTKINKQKLESPRCYNLGLYLHIPFCAEKCAYCDFLSFGGSQEQEQQAYIQALLGEIRYYGRLLGKDCCVDTVFIGGGTPSLLSSQAIQQIMSSIKAEFALHPQAEVTIEANPGTLTEEKLSAYLGAGINRLSMGVQSMNDNRLAELGRIHKAAQVRDNYQAARKAGFKNINLDFMFAIPSHTMEVWEDSLRQAIALAPEHLSFYSLQLEEGTGFFELFQQGKLDQLSDEEDRAMYHRAIDILTGAGYEHYEISNMAKPGYECVHNLKYWSMKDYLGLGLGAHSYLAGRRFSNRTDLPGYQKAVAEGWTKSGENGFSNTTKKIGVPSWVDWYHENTMDDEMGEFVFTGLRKLEGISLMEFQRRFGRDFFDVYETKKELINQYIRDGYMRCEKDFLMLTIKGIDISNSIMAEFV